MGPTRRNLLSPPFLIGTLLCLCALTFYYVAVLRTDYHKTILLDLTPYPDAVEYFAQAKAISEGRDPSIQIGYDNLPSRYPPGYPALMLPWLKLLGDNDMILAPFRTNQTIGLLLLVIIFATYAHLGRPVTGGLAVLLLTTLPAFFTFCRSSLSEISGSGSVALSFICVYFGLKDRKRWLIYVAAIFLGIAVDIRTQLLLFLPLLLAMAMFPAKQAKATWLLHCAAALLVFAIAATPVLLVNYAWFGNPFSTGYHFWVPRLPHIFSIRNVPEQAAVLWTEFAANWQVFRVANIFGTGTYFVAPFIVLVGLGFLFVRLSRFVLCALLSGFAFFAATSAYVLPEGRFFFPIMILSVGIAVLPVEWAARAIHAGRHATRAYPIMGLFLLACAGFPSQSGSPPRLKTRRFQAWDALHFTDRHRESARFAAFEEFVGKTEKSNGVVFSDIDPVYLNALLPKGIVAAPVDGRHHYRSSQIWRYDKTEAVTLGIEALSHSVAVYAVFVRVADMSPYFARLPVIPGYEWRVISTGQHAVILNLAVSDQQ